MSAGLCPTFVLSTASISPKVRCYLPSLMEQCLKYSSESLNYPTSRLFELHEFVCRVFESLICIC